MTIQNKAQVRTNRPNSRNRPVAQGLDTKLSDLDIFAKTTSETTPADLGAIRYQLRNFEKSGVPGDHPISRCLLGWRALGHHAARWVLSLEGNYRPTLSSVSDSCGSVPSNQQAWI